jgi:hypothetical protein
MTSNITPTVLVATWCDGLFVVGGELPKWIDGIADTGCIATHGSAVAIADRNGNIYLSGDTGRSWSSQSYGFPLPSSVLIA